MSPKMANRNRGIVDIFAKKCQYKLNFNPCLHWRRLRDNARDSDSHYLLALATLGDMTQIGLFLFLDATPKVAKANTVMTVMCRCC
jgi:hypothetical protein